MTAIPYRVTVDRRQEWERKREQWTRAEVLAQYVRQSAATVAGGRAEYALAEIADAQDRETDPEFSFCYGGRNG
jgi:hypothetical protein